MPISSCKLHVCYVYVDRLQVRLDLRKIVQSQLVGTLFSVSTLIAHNRGVVVGYTHNFLSWLLDSTLDKNPLSVVANALSWITRGFLALLLTLSLRFSLDLPQNTLLSDALTRIMS